jgi:hypothetical protein
MGVLAVQEFSLFSGVSCSKMNGGMFCDLKAHCFSWHCIADVIHPPKASPIIVVGTTLQRKIAIRVELEMLNINWSSVKYSNISCINLPFRDDLDGIQSQFLK